MAGSRLLERLIERLQIMPGVGPVSAARIAYSLLRGERTEGLELAQSIREALEGVSLCPRCRDYSDDGELCPLCASARRAQSGLLCVVESPTDLQAMESAACYGGRYFVLHGHLSPIDAVGPEELGLGALETLVHEPGLNELILALGQTVEGQATAQYIAAMARPLGILVTLPATGIPLGGELSALDGGTLANSLSFRRPL